MSINVLLADDSVPAQNMGKKILVDAGYTVMTVNNGLEALRRITESAPDVAILDIFMPGYTGLEICKRLRASAATSAIPVILTVGKMEPYRPEDGELVHSNAVIVKPFAATELISAVRSLIGVPHTEAAAQPRLGMEGPPAKAAPEDPLQDDYLTTEDVIFPNLRAPGQPANSELLKEALPEGVAEGPLFSNPLSEGEGNAAASAHQEPSVYSGEPLLSSTTSDGAASLAFDPDAKHTPFSASAVDLLPPPSHSDAGRGGTAFTEFDMETESSPHASAPASGKSTRGGPSPETFAPTGQVDLVANASEPVLTDAKSLDAQEVVSGSIGAAELESSGLDVPALDPLLEVREVHVPPSILGASCLEVGESPDQIFPDFSAENVASTEEPPASLAPEEEARRAAFEALFNSDEVLPLEELPASCSLSAPAVLPSISDISKDFDRDIEPDAELEVLGDDGQQHFVDPGLDPNIVEEGQTADGLLSTIGTIPDHDLLLDGALAQTGWQETAGSVQKSEEATAWASSTMNLPQTDAVPGMAPASMPEVNPAEAAPEAHAETAKPIPVELVHRSEIEQTTPEAAPEQPQIPPEAMPAKTQTDEPGHVRAAEAAVASIVAEATAMHAMPVAAPAELVSGRVEATPAQAAPVQPEQHTVENFLSQEVFARPNEAERVHQAVERVFERFKPLLIAAIVRELARRD